MPRPGPLQELPLEQFLPPNPNLPYPTTSSRKRPLSPGGPNLFSPTKRRILTQEGIFSPEKTFKSPLSAWGTPARFTEALTGPGSPAKKLDFGSPKPLSASPAVLPRPAAEATPPRTTRSSSRLAPSPSLQPTAWAFSSQSSDDQEMDDYFSQPSTSSSMPPPSSNPIVVPPQTPPPPDPQSIHYPGFHVYFDAHLIVSPVEEAAQLLTSGGEKDKEEVKENLPPRRKARKAVTAPDTDLKSQLLSPRTKQREIEKLSKPKSTPATPKKALTPSEPVDSPTPRRPTTRLLREETSSTPRLTEREKKGMRRLLQDEADDEEAVA